MKGKLAHAGVVVGWLVVVLGALKVGVNLPVLYMLLSGQVEPGKAYWVDGLAPTTQQVAIDTAVGCIILVIGFAVIAVARKYKVNEPPGA